MKAYCAIPVLQVKSIEAAVGFYVNVLGFTKNFQMRDFAGVHLGKAAIHLCNHDFHRRPLGGGAVSIVCEDVDAYYGMLLESQAPIKVEIAERRYGMKDFAVSDPDGNVLTFGHEIKKKASS